jgi:hypothetical protein
MAPARLACADPADVQGCRLARSDSDMWYYSSRALLLLLERRESDFPLAPS